MARFFHWLGDNAHALEYYDKAFRLMDSIPHGDQSYTNKLSMLQLNKGITLYHMRKTEEGLELLKKSEKIKEGLGHVYLGSVYFNLARSYEKLSAPDLAGPYYLKAINRWISEYDSTHFQLANIYLDYGQFLVDQGERKQGYAYLNKALSNYAANYGIHHPLTAACYEKLARYWLSEKDLEMALDLLQNALISVSTTFHSKDILKNPDVNDSNHELTMLKILASKAGMLAQFAEKASSAERKSCLLETALETNTFAIKVMHRIQDSYLSRESRTFLTSRQKDLFARGIQMNIKMYHLTGREDYLEKAFLLAARGKSNELLFELKTKEWLYLASLPDTVAHSVTTIKRKIDHLSNLIQLESEDVNPDSVQMAFWKESLFRIRNSFNQQMEELRSAYPQIGQFEFLTTDLSMERIRGTLKKKETLLEFFMSNSPETGRKQLLVFVVTRSELNFKQVRIDSSFSQKLEIIRNNLHGYNPYGETLQNYDSLKLALFGIYSQVVKPIESLFAGESILIVPDEELAYLPFDALLTHYKPEANLNYPGLPYLLHRYDLFYLTNSHLINRQKSMRARFPKINAWIPDYSSSGADGPVNLPGAVEEVHAILKDTRGRSIRSFTDKAIAGKLLEEKAVIHLAMHALGTEGTSVSPYFLLDAEKDSLHSNRLFDYEINALSIVSPMVVLSSCETASGSLLPGEGIKSLSRSILQAGAGAVVHTLWQVDDVKGSNIMTEFYRQLKRGLSISNAMSEAKKHYLAHTPPIYTHPYYWATYQVTGNTTPLISPWRNAFLAVMILSFCIVCFYLMRRNFLARS